jgi:hypothetical protein
MSRAPIARPNGKLYRPRTIRTQVMGPEDEAPTSIVVLGTRDVAEAEAAARLDAIAFSDLMYSGDYVLVITPDEPREVWYRKSLLAWDEIDGPRFSFETDEEHGAAGLEFTVREVDRLEEPDVELYPPRQPASCRVCGCTDADCSGCIERTGQPCMWVPGEGDLCTACVGRAV